MIEDGFALHLTGFRIDMKTGFYPSGDAVGYMFGQLSAITANRGQQFDFNANPLAWWGHEGIALTNRAADFVRQCFFITTDDFKTNGFLCFDNIYIP